MVCSSPTDRFAAEDEPPVLQTAQHLWPKSSYPASCLWRGSTRRRLSQRRPQQTKPLAASNHEQSIAHPPPNNLSGEPHHTRRAFAHRTPFILLFPRGVTKANQDPDCTRQRTTHTRRGSVAGCRFIAHASASARNITCLHGYLNCSTRRKNMMSILAVDDDYLMSREVPHEISAASPSQRRQVQEHA